MALKKSCRGEVLFYRNGCGNDVVVENPLNACEYENSKCEYMDNK